MMFIINCKDARFAQELRSRLTDLPELLVDSKPPSEFYRTSSLDAIYITYTGACALGAELPADPQLHKIVFASTPTKYVQQGLPGLLAVGGVITESEFQDPQLRIEATLRPILAMTKEASLSGKGVNRIGIDSTYLSLVDYGAAATEKLIRAILVERAK